MSHWEASAIENGRGKVAQLELAGTKRARVTSLLPITNLLPNRH
jgi:hypothetical protein